MLGLIYFLIDMTNNALTSQLGISEEMDNIIYRFGNSSKINELINIMNKDNDLDINWNLHETEFNKYRDNLLLSYDTNLENIENEFENLENRKNIELDNLKNVENEIDKIELDKEILEEKLSSTKFVNDIPNEGIIGKNNISEQIRLLDNKLNIKNEGKYEILNEIEKIKIEKKSFISENEILTDNLDGLISTKPNDNLLNYVEDNDFKWLSIDYDFSNFFTRNNKILFEPNNIDNRINSTENKSFEQIEMEINIKNKFQDLIRDMGNDSNLDKNFENKLPILMETVDEVISADVGLETFFIPKSSEINNVLKLLKNNEEIIKNYTNGENLLDNFVYKNIDQKQFEKTIEQEIEELILENENQKIINDVKDYEIKLTILGSEINNDYNLEENFNIKYSSELDNILNYIVENGELPETKLNNYNINIDKNYENNLQKELELKNLDEINTKDIKIQKELEENLYNLYNEKQKLIEENKILVSKKEIFNIEDSEYFYLEDHYSNVYNYNSEKIEQAYIDLDEKHNVNRNELNLGLNEEEFYKFQSEIGYLHGINVFFSKFEHGNTLISKVKNRFIDVGEKDYDYEDITTSIKKDEGYYVSEKFFEKYGHSYEFTFNDINEGKIGSECCFYVNDLKYIYNFLNDYELRIIMDNIGIDYGKGIFKENIELKNEDIKIEFETIQNNKNRIIEIEEEMKIKEDEIKEITNNIDKNNLEITELKYEILTNKNNIGNIENEIIEFNTEKMLFDKETLNFFIENEDIIKNSLPNSGNYFYNNYINSEINLEILQDSINNENEITNNIEEFLEKNEKLHEISLNNNMIIQEQIEKINMKDNLRDYTFDLYQDINSNHKSENNYLELFEDLDEKLKTYTNNNITNYEIYNEILNPFERSTTKIKDFFQTNEEIQGTNSGEFIYNNYIDNDNFTSVYNNNINLASIFDIVADVNSKNNLTINDFYPFINNTNILNNYDPGEIGLNFGYSSKNFILNNQNELDNLGLNEITDYVNGYNKGYSKGVFDVLPEERIEKLKDDDLFMKKDFFNNENSINQEDILIENVNVDENLINNLNILKRNQEVEIQNMIQMENKFEIINKYHYEVREFNSNPNLEKFEELKTYLDPLFNEHNMEHKDLGVHYSDKSIEFLLNPEIKNMYENDNFFNSLINEKVDKAYIDNFSKEEIDKIKEGENVIKNIEENYNQDNNINLDLIDKNTNTNTEISKMNIQNIDFLKESDNQNIKNCEESLEIITKSFDKNEPKSFLIQKAYADKGIENSKENIDYGIGDENSYISKVEDGLNQIAITSDNAGMYDGIGVSILLGGGIRTAIGSSKYLHYKINNRTMKFRGDKDNIYNKTKDKMKNIFSNSSKNYEKGIYSN